MTTRSEIHARLLGPLELQQGQAAIPLGRPAQRALLARLLLDANRTVAVDHLVDDLWGEDAPASAVKMIQIHVSNLRKVLPSGMLVTRPPGYALEIQPEAVDLVRFERLRKEGRAALAARVGRGGRRQPARRARALAGTRPRGVRRALRRGRVGSPRGAAPGVHGGPDRSRPRTRPARRPRRRARGARRAQPAAGAASGPAHAGAVPLRTAGGGAGRLPAAQGAVLDRARDRALAAAARARAAHAPARPDARARPGRAAASPGTGSRRVPVGDRRRVAATARWNERSVNVPAASAVSTNTPSFFPARRSAWTSATRPLAAVCATG